MTGIIRKTRTSQGISMKELADRMGVGVQAVSTLELNDERGAIKVETRDRALRALGKRALPIVVDALPDDIVADVEAEARALVERTQWSMAMSGQGLSDDAVNRLVQKVVAKRLAASVAPEEALVSTSTGFEAKVRKREPRPRGQR